MKILSSLLSLYFSMKNGWHTGKGSKYLNKKDNKTAINHLLIALKSSEKTNNKANVAYSHEILADAYLRTGEYDKAEEHAKHSCEMYSNFLESCSSKVFSERLGSSKQLLMKIRHNQSFQ